MKFKSDIEVQAGLKDSSGSNGSSGQVLSSDGATVSWVNAGSSVASDVQNEVKAGVAINKGQAVYVTGADGTNIIVGLASNTSEATSSKTLGLLNATVAVNGFADVVQIGKLSGLNTIGANTGDPVWLGVNGNLIYGLANKPYAPAHLVFIGIVTRVNANNGEIFVTVQNGFELKEIHDVDIITNVPINGDVLGYDGTLWVNKTIAEWLGYTPVPNTRALTINGNTQNLTADRTWTIDIGINGSGTVNTLSKFTGTTTIGDSQIKDSGTSVSIGYTTNPNSYKLDVNGDVNINTDLYVSGTFPYTIKAAGGVNVDDAFGVYWKTDVGGIGGTLAGIGQSSSGLDFYTNSSFLAPKLRILANGNVTIGTLAGSGSRMVVADATGVLSTQAIPPSGVTSFNTRTGAITLTSGDVTTALGYTPVTEARTITINGVTQDLTANRSWTVTAPETDTLATVTARGALSTGNMFTPVNGGLFFNGNGLYNTGVYGNGNDLWFNAGSTQKAALNSSGDFTANASVRSPIFYDSNNTGFYGDFASTSNFNKLLLNSENTFNAATPGLTSYGLTLMGGTSDYANGVTWTWGNTNAQAGVYVQSSGAYGTKMYFATTDSFATGSKTGMSMDHNGTVLVTRSYLQSDSSLRAPIFYDSNDTSYYADLNSTSQSAVKQRGGTLHGPNTTWGAYLLVGGNGRTDYINNVLTASVVSTDGNLHLDAGSTKSTYLNWYDGNSLIFGNGSEAQIGTVNNSGDLQMAGSVRAPIFYDSNNTGYYIDPASVSNLNVLAVSRAYAGYDSGNPDSFSCSNWFRSSGATGWYNQTYTGGWYMIDSTYVRSYNDKDVYTGGIMLAGASHRAPVFYDSNDTGYYLDPASTTTSLQIAGAVEQGNNLSRPLVQWGQSGNVTGPVVIKLPGNTSNYGMIHAVIDIYEYNSNDVCTVIVGGHNWSSQWYNYGAEVIGNTNKPVRLAVKDGKFCIVIGDGASTWEYGQVVLRKIQNGTYYNNIMDLGGTYSIGIESDSYSWVSGNLNSFSSSSITATVAVSAPIYYDLNNTGYYVDPASVSTINSLALAGTLSGPNNVVYGDGANGRSKDRTSQSANTSDSSNSSGFYFGNGTTGMPSGDWWNWLTVAGNNWSGGDGYRWQMAYSFWGDDVRIRRQQSGSWYAWQSLLHSGNYSAYSNFSGAVYGTIFYDNNNTGYYVDPSSTSNLYELQLTGASNKYLYLNPGNGYEAMVRYNGGSGYSWYVGKRITGTTQAGTADFHFYSEAAGDTVAGIDAIGTFRAKGDVVAYSSSDKQLKDNIKPIENALEKVKQIGGYTFDWNDKQDTYKGHDVGIIAQEIEVVLPEVVITRDTGYKAVKYEKIVPLLIEAIKEQQTQIEELKELVNKLINKQ